MRGKIFQTQSKLAHVQLDFLKKFVRCRIADTNIDFCIHCLHITTYFFFFQSLLDLMPTLIHLFFFQNIVLVLYSNALKKFSFPTLLNK